jgi:hypothetical protein
MWLIVPRQAKPVHRLANVTIFNQVSAVVLEKAPQFIAHVITVQGVDRKTVLANPVELFLEV